MDRYCLGILLNWKRTIHYTRYFSLWSHPIVALNFFAHVWREITVRFVATNLVEVSWCDRQVRYCRCMPSHVLLHLRQQITPQILAVHRVGNVRGEESRLRAAVVALALELEAVERL